MARRGVVDGHIEWHREEEVAALKAEELDTSTVAQRWRALLPDLEPPQTKFMWILSWFSELDLWLLYGTVVATFSKNLPKLSVPKAILACTLVYMLHYILTVMPADRRAIKAQQIAVLVSAVISAIVLIHTMSERIATTFSIPHFHTLYLMIFYHTIRAFVPRTHFQVALSASAWALFVAGIWLPITGALFSFYSFFVVIVGVVTLSGAMAIGLGRVVMGGANTIVRRIKR